MAGADLPISRISWETPAFWSHLPVTRRITKISRIYSTKFGQLILSKMVKIVATRCHTLRLKCPNRPRPHWKTSGTVLSQTS